MKTVIPLRLQHISMVTALTFSYTMLNRRCHCSPQQAREYPSEESSATPSHLSYDLLCSCQDCPILVSVRKSGWRGTRDLLFAVRTRCWRCCNQVNHLASRWNFVARVCLLSRSNLLWWQLRHIAALPQPRRLPKRAYCDRYEAQWPR